MSAYPDRYQNYQPDAEAILSALIRPAPTGNGGSDPVVPETTALGAAYAAGLAVGFWKDTDELRQNWNESKRCTPQWSEEQREEGYAGWRKAVQRTLDWVDVS